MRVDSSSRFPTGNKYATFPSVSAAWRVSNESFMLDQDLIDNMKIRLGWGRVGNQSIANSAYISTIGSSDYVFGNTPTRVPGTTITSVGNSNLRWETVEDYNLGLDITLLDNRLDVIFDLYQKKSYDMLYRKQNVFVTGYPDWNGQVWMNIGSMKASDGAGLNWRDKVVTSATGGLNCRCATKPSSSQVTDPSSPAASLATRSVATRMADSSALPWLPCRQHLPELKR